jgi:hypothetical protein
VGAPDHHQVGPAAEAIAAALEDVAAIDARCGPRTLGLLAARRLVAYVRHRVSART